VVATRQSNAGRLVPLDLLRGLMTTLMALDHTSYFVAQKHPAGEYWAGPFPTYDSALPFLTRLVTHLAAPGFFLLMGAGMSLFARSRLAQGWRRRAVIRHFILRGTMLVALQFLIINQVWELSPGGWQLDLYVGVIAALGGTMIIASLLVWLPPSQLVLLAAALLIGTELAVPDATRWSQGLSVAARLTVTSGGDNHLWSNYPLLAWLELVTFGMAVGYWLQRDPQRLYRSLPLVGAAFLVLFTAIRVLDGFGNLRPRAGDGWIDFFNVVKYPPSIAFTLLTTGLNLILLGLIGAASARRPRLLAPFGILGRAPLFFYVTHLFLYAGLGRWLAPRGTSILAMIPYWLLGLLLLLPLCGWYGRLKHRQPAASTLRFF
jgi:uncharacterized membrane protein